MKLLILAGLFASGKNTIVKAGRVLLDPFYHFSSGEHFRQEIKKESALGRLIKTDVSEGQYISDATVNAVCSQEIPKLIDGEKILWLDGVPRTPGQVSFLLDDLLPKNGIHHSDIVVLNITTPAEECRQRAKQQSSDPDRMSRPDANLKAALERIQTDLEQIPVMLDFLARYVPYDRRFDFDGTEMRRNAPAFLRRMGFRFPEERLKSYLSEVSKSHPELPDQILESLKNTA